MKRHQVFLASVLAVVATPALAAPMAVDFVATSVNATTPFMTGDADGIFNLQSTWDPIDAAGPMAGLQGPCFGAARMTGGLFTGNGYCAFKDSDGETAIVHWWMENAPGPAGVWAIVGGTGKWATATGGGLFADSPGEGEGMTKTHITGMVDVK
jgi:hypothetical protein